MAVTVSTVLTAGVVSFSTFFGKAQHEYQADVELTNLSRQCLEKLVWGHKSSSQPNRRGIAEARSGQVIAADHFRYTDISGNSHELRLNAGTVEYWNEADGSWETVLDPNGSMPNDPLSYALGLLFADTSQPNAVVIKIVIGKNLRGSWHYGSATTTVFFRNAS